MLNFSARACKFAELFPNSYTATCEQKYIYRPMVGIDELGGTIKELFKIPSCCKCVIRPALRHN